eukprot:IDg4475t1
MRLTEDVLAPQQARNKILQEHCEVITFSNSPAGCDECDAVEYFNILPRRTLQRIKASEVDDPRQLEAQEGPTKRNASSIQQCTRKLLGQHSELALEAP